MRGFSVTLKCTILTNSANDNCRHTMAWYFPANVPRQMDPTKCSKKKHLQVEGGLRCSPRSLALSLLLWLFGAAISAWYFQNIRGAFILTLNDPCITRARTKVSRLRKTSPPASEQYQYYQQKQCLTPKPEVLNSTTRLSLIYLSSTSLLQ